ncbi:piggyBac transposable element-derived protein 3-like [Ornithodoros turicata]|uniref:piggyBac transposable element-derived protein 3-like n=1 Tax=Ornithodoros turicata TaxID=34597 RepID=UPI0031388B39
MDTQSFYGRRRQPCQTRLPPEQDSDDSCLSDSDDDVDYIPPDESNAQCEEASEGEEDDDDDNSEEAAHTSKGGKPRLNWSRVSAFRHHSIPKWKGSIQENDDVRSAVDYFRGFFDDSLIKLIVTQSNLSAVQKDPNKPFAITELELEQFLGCTLFMSVIQLPRTRLYWSAQCRVSAVADIMSRDRWEEIKSSLHFNDNLNMPSTSSSDKDRLFKIRPLLEALHSKFEEILQAQTLCVDEQMVPFKGRSSLKQYLPKKPHKWGYKIFVMCDSHGIAHSFEVYTGIITPVPGFPDIGPSGNIVLKLSERVKPNLNHLLFFDNWFTSIPLLLALAARGIYGLGTVRANRLQGCQMTSDAALRASGRGSSEEYKTVQDKQKVIAVKWYDNRTVTTASTFAGIEPKSTVKQWDRKRKETVEIECPNAISTYNRHMGGVDLLDGLVAYYRTEVRSKKYYLKIFFHFLDVVVVVSWLFYRRDCQSMGVPKSHQKDLMKFKLAIAEALCKQGKDLHHKKRG